jgi:hypothetical protein
MREIKLSLEMATKWYGGIVPELKALALQTYPELAVKELPKTWEELGKIEGYYVDSYSDVNYIDIVEVENLNKNIFATKDQAEASIALAQLSQLLAIYNDEWVADYVSGEHFYVIYFDSDKIEISKASKVKSFLNFKYRKTAELFLENFKDLIQTAKPLL